MIHTSQAQPLMHRRTMMMACAAGAAVPLLSDQLLAATAGATPNRDMIQTLGAPDRIRSSSENPQAAAFDEFVGTWDVDFTTIADDGTRTKATGQFIAGWILEGRGLQDIWIQNPADKASPRFMGTTLRFFDETKGLWRVTWVAPIVNAVALLEGKRNGNSIILFGSSPRGVRRWSFHDIEADRFTWQNHLSTDQGKSWRLQEDHVMSRARGPA